MSFFTAVSGLSACRCAVVHFFDSRSFDTLFFRDQSSLRRVPLKATNLPMVSESFFYSYVGAIQDQVEKAVSSELTKSGAAKVIVGGHSLGSGVACICAVLLRDYLQKVHSAAEVELCVAATPKPGNAAFRSLLATMKCTSYANETDIIPWNPSSVIPDLTRASGLLEYVMPPGLCTFSVVAPTLTGCHAVASYRLGITALGGAPSAK